jgi:hypothetical protein
MTIAGEVAAEGELRLLVDLVQGRSHQAYSAEQFTVSSLFALARAGNPHAKFRLVSKFSDTEISKQNYRLCRIVAPSLPSYACPTRKRRT